MTPVARSRPAVRCACIAVGLAAALGACATTEQTRSVEPSGFLGDYSQLEPGGEGEALLVYRNPHAHFAAYSVVMIDPVRIWRTADSDISDVPEPELRRLADYLYAALEKQLKRDYAVAGRRGPATLQIRAAITEAKGSNVPMDVASTVLPQMRLLSGVDKLASGTHAFVGRAAVEAEILDSLSGERLLAAVDERAGGKTLEGVTGSWSDVEEAFDHWAERLRTRLTELRTQQP